MSQEIKTDLVNEKLPLNQLLPLGFQHVLAMYAGAIAIPIIIAGGVGLTQSQLTFLIAADLFTCGIATILQAVGIGNFAGVKLPVILGCTFTAVGPIIGIGNEFGMQSVYGAIIISGLFMVLIAPLFRKIIKFFPEVVTGSIVTILGGTLIPAGIHMAAGGIGSATYGNPKHFALAGFVMLVIIVLNRYLKGFMQTLAILIGIIAGTILASFMGMVNFSEVANAKWFSIIQPLHFGTPQFHLSAIFTMCLVAIVTMIESMGIFLSVGKMCKKEVTSHDMVKGIRIEGISTMLGGFLNTFPYSTYSNNVGVLALTKIHSRFVVVAAGCFLVVLGGLPKFAALATVVPSAVFGGATLIIFGSVCLTGIRMLQSVDFEDNGNLFVASTSIAIGLGTGVVPGLFDQFPSYIKLIFGEGGVVAGSIVAVALNIFFHFGKSKKKEQTNNINQNIA